MFSLFKNSKKHKKKAMVFVDYEHWYISLYRLHKTRPDIRSFRDELAEKYDIGEIIFFGDFSNSSMRAELPKIRQISNHIIETQNTSPTHKKDFTDFIMLDHIYQNAINSPDTDVFVLFTGDGHFLSVTNYLISKLGKEVGVYAIRGGLSGQLKSTASWCCLLPKNEDPKLEGYKTILENLRQLSENKTKKTYPTFKGTVTALSKAKKMKPHIASGLLRDLIDKECIIPDQHVFENGKKIKTINVDWKRCTILGYWD